MAYRLLAHALTLCLFVLAYYLPLLLAYDPELLQGPEVGRVVQDALANGLVRLEIARNSLGHVLALGACYVGICLVATRFSISARVPVLWARTYFIIVGTVFLAVLNQQWFPLSDYGRYLPATRSPGLLLISGGLLLAAVFAAVWPAALGAIARIRDPITRTNGVPTSVLCCIASAMALGMNLGGGEGAAHAAGTANRNVIIIGVDSLSESMARDSRDELPNLSALLEGGTRYEQAFTPLARTFPAWVSVLSGRYPADHGAVFNLRNLEKVERADLLSQGLRQSGYRTVFATDERRFSNIDETFGFDAVVGPKAGALDFVIQRFNDTPLTNLLMQLPLARSLFPYSRLNVASFANYDSAGFVDEVLEAASGSGPVFLAVHFQSAHYPYVSRHAVGSAGSADSFRDRHLSTLRVVDMQVGRLLAGLRSRGLLSNALIVVMSDHGEGLGEREASTTRFGAPFEVSGYGHGTDLLSIQENRVILAAIQFEGGNRVPPHGAQQTRPELVSLTGIRAMVERYVSGDEPFLDAADACMTVETGLRFAAAADFKDIDEAAVAREGAVFYEIDNQGRARLREDRLASLVDSKDVGLRCEGRITVFSRVERKYLAYRFGKSPDDLIETEPLAADIRRIEDYRQRLRGVGSPS